MNTLTYFVLLGSTITLLLSGCAHHRPISDADAIGIADRAATKHGFHLAEFEPGRILSHEGSRWCVSYDSKILPNRDGLFEVKFGADFLVWVDERTGATQIGLGE